MLYEVKRVPVNAKQLFYKLFPFKNLISRPEELLPETVVIDTSFDHIAHFQDFARLLEQRSIPYFLVTNLPHFDSEDLSAIEAFRFIIFFDLDLPPSQYELLKEAGKYAISVLPMEEVSVLPKVLTLGYTQLEIDDNNIQEALIVIEQGIEHFCFCPMIAQRAKELRQFKRLLISPPYLEQELQRVSPKPIFRRENTKEVKFLSIYWLNELQLREMRAKTKGGCCPETFRRRCAPASPNPH